MSWFEDGGSARSVDVKAMFDSALPELVARIVASGALVAIGTTSDGGALGITVTMDGRWRREYFRDSDEAMDWLLGAAEAVEGEAARLAASPAQRSRGRGRKPA